MIVFLVIITAINSFMIIGLSAQLVQQKKQDRALFEMIVTVARKYAERSGFDEKNLDGWKH